MQHRCSGNFCPIRGLFCSRSKKEAKLNGEHVRLDTRGSFKESGSVHTDSPSSSLAGVDKTRVPSCQASQRQLGTQHTWPPSSIVENRWDENAGLRRDVISSQVIDALCDTFSFQIDDAEFSNDIHHVRAWRGHDVAGR